MCCILHLNAQSLLQDLPKLNDNSISFQQSSYDRSGKNDDRLTQLEKNYYDVIPEGKVNNPNGISTGKNEYVICSLEGPSVLERFWVFTFPFASDIRFRFYFDGEMVPRINKTFNELFIYQEIPFVKPLVQNLYESSGGFYSYMQLPVSNSLIVTVDSAVVYSQFGIRQLSRDSIVQSWIPANDNSYLSSQFLKSGTYPKYNFQATILDSSVFTLAPKQTLQVFHSASKGVIDAVQMCLPQLNYSLAAFVQDSGVYHKGSSKFNLSVNRNASVVKLIKRSNKMYHLDFVFWNLFENAKVSINNITAGNWRNVDYRTYRYWQNDTFVIPAYLFQNKNELAIQLQYQNGEPWNEFYYWISCDGVITDSLDIGDVESEIQHNYSVTNIQSNYYSKLNNRYNSTDVIKKHNRQILDSVFVKIYFDNEDQASVYAPIGLFFATGVNDATYMQSLPCGNINGEFYNYFSMPFWTNVKIELVNKSSISISDLVFKVRTGINNYDINTTGYFKTVWNKEVKEITDNTDYLIANWNGKGKYVGTVVEAEQQNNFDLCWIEGDERVYVDDAQTPFIHGTGTEDYFNSSVYFYFDEYSLPQNGMTNSDNFYHKSSYRFHLTDPIVFQKNIRFQLEHGWFNNKFGDYTSLAFLYVQPSRFVLTDELDVGNKNSESFHQYTVSSNRSLIYKLSSYEGEKYKDKLIMDGYSVYDSVSFSVAVSPCNTGVSLLRTLDYSIANQMSKVFVDDSFVGIWTQPGSNITSSFRDDYFVLPVKFTRYKSKLNIKLVNQNRENAWTEMYYKVYSTIDSLNDCGIVNNIENDYLVFPSIAQYFTSLSTSDKSITQIIVSTESGAVIHQFKWIPESVSKVMDVSVFSNGIYFISFLHNGNIVKTKKLIIVR